MILRECRFAVLLVASCALALAAEVRSASFEQSGAASQPDIRVVILKLDGLNADLLYSTLAAKDPQTGLSMLPWFNRIFAERGVVFENFYTRGISLSTPSWSMLDTGHHGIIRGNAEYDRYTGEVYDYLNVFPFYVNYARQRQVDMPGVEVLDRAGIPLVIDAFAYPQTYQSFQLLQRGTRFTTLRNVLTARFSSRTLFATLENGDSPSLDQLWREQTEKEIGVALANKAVLYVDLFNGDADHLGHATSNAAAQLAVLKSLDAIAGRLWTEIQESAYARKTLFVAVSDHGMNNVPGVFSQAFSLADLLNSPEGGAHHVVTNRHPLSDYKLSALDPMVDRVVTPSTRSLYLDGEASRYPTAWLDLDGNERASVQLRNSDLNRIQILLQQLKRSDLDRRVRQAGVTALNAVLDRHRAGWARTSAELKAELDALQGAIEVRVALLKKQPRRWSAAAKAEGADKAARRLAKQLSDWRRERRMYSGYISKIESLLDLHVSAEVPWTGSVQQSVPELASGDPNTVGSLQHYVVGPGPHGLTLAPDGGLDENASFTYVDNFAVLAAQRVRNNPQAALSPKPIDFTVMRLTNVTMAGIQNVYWLYRDGEKQLLILQGGNGAISLKPVSGLHEDANGKLAWTETGWQSGLPLALFEDSALEIPEGPNRSGWLSTAHTEREWLEATHRCHYSDAVIGITEVFSPVENNVPGPPGLSPILLRYERRRRELVQPDFEIFAADHWNFDIRNFNPGGNHGSFFRISTHSVWMMSGASLPSQRIQTPYDSLNFASTILNLAGRTVPDPARVVVIPSH